MYIFCSDHNSSFSTETWKEEEKEGTNVVMSKVFKRFLRSWAIDWLYSPDSVERAVDQPRCKSVA